LAFGMAVRLGRNKVAQAARELGSFAGDVANYYSGGKKRRLPERHTRAEKQG